MKKLLNTKVDRLIPNELLKLMLKSKVDLLWNGGIGTFVKASYEAHEHAGDRTNDALRIDATDLSCKVIGEGGNLGFTQNARVEFAMCGGHVYTDFIDNSAGVDCSDHEVNIKILLNAIVSDGELTEKQRNQLLADMTDEISRLVLENNYLQTQAISVATSRSMIDVELYSRFLNGLASRGEIDIKIENLPDETQLMERKSQGKGLTSPEMSVLFAYSKNITRDSVLKSDLPDDPYLIQFMARAFPKVLTERYGKYLERHSLRKEIISTQIGNILVNEMGIIFPWRLIEETGAPLAPIVRAYVIAREVYSFVDISSAIEDLDYKVPSKVQYEMIVRLIRQVRRATRWFLRNRHGDINIEEMIEYFKPGLEHIRSKLPTLLTGTTRERFDKFALSLAKQHVPKDIHTQIAGTSALLSALDIIEVAKKYDVEIDEAAKVYFEVGEFLHLDWFREQINTYQVQDHWEALARVAHHDDLDWQQRELAAAVLVQGDGLKGADEKIKQWSKQYEYLLQRWEDMCTRLKSASAMEIVMFSVALRELLDLTQTCAVSTAAKQVKGKSVSAKDKNVLVSKSGGEEKQPNVAN